VTAEQVPESQTRLRRFGPLGLVVAGVVMFVALAAALLLFPAVPVLSYRLMGWELHGFAGRGFDPTTAQTTDVVRVAVAQWPTEFDQGDSSWLATPLVTYTPWSVTITLYTTDAFTQQKMHGWYDTGGWVNVKLSEPLRGRMLFDGSKFPPAARRYP
jgi:hypothetical protein